MLKTKSLKNLGYTAALVFITATASLLFLSTGFSSDLDSNTETEVEFIVGELKTVKAYSPTRVAVADPAVVDVDRVEGDNILLAAKKVGNTSLAIWDKYGERTIQVRVYAEELESLKNRLRKLLANFEIKDLTFKASKEEGKVILQGEVLTDDKKALDEILSPFSNRIINLIKSAPTTDIVQFDVQIFELTKSAAEELGVTWLQAMQVREEPYSSSSSTTGGVVTTLNKIDTFAKIFRVVDFSRDALNAKLNFLINEGKARVLSRPKLVCLSGKEAEFLVGGEVPIVTTTTSSGGNVSTNVEYRKYGVNLKVKPVVKNDEVDTTINTEVSDIDNGNAVIVSGTKVPAFASRNASTQVYLKDGQTIFIAGLIKNKDSTNVSGIPFLKDIPFLGAAFREKSFSSSDTELVISLTPTIIRTSRKPTSIGAANLEVVPPISQSVPAVAEESEATVEAEINPQVSVVGQADTADSVVSYARSVQGKIAQAITFPAEAKKYQWQGMVKLGLRILYDGSLIDAVVKDSSGYDILDQNALAAAKKQAPFLAFPADIAAQELSIDVPVVYKTEP